MHYYILLLDKFEIKVSDPYHDTTVRDACAYIAFAHTNCQRQARLWRATMGSDGRLVYGEEYTAEELGESLCAGF